MNTPHIITRSFAIFTAITALMATQSFAQDKAPKEQRIGIYDSRAVAIAYVGSTFLKEEMQELTTKHKKAKAAGDEKEASRLEAEGGAKQAKLHQQGFSTAPVDDLLAYISSALPKIQDAADLSATVSKWDKASLEKHSKSEKVDVTMQLVDAFHPDERTRLNAIDIQKKAPVPLDQLGKHY